MQSSIILALSIVATVLLTRFAPLYQWIRGFSLTPIGAFLLYLLFFGTLFLGGPRAITSELVDPLRLARMALFAAITGLAWLDLILHRRNKASINTAIWIMLIYGAFASATAAWSPNPMLTLWKGFEIITHVSVVAIIARRVRSIDDALNMLGLFWVFILFVSISLLISIPITPGDAFAESSKGIEILHGVAFTVNPNTGTQIGALLMVVGISLSIAPKEQTNRGVVLAVITLGAVVVFFTHSRTSIFATVIVICMIAAISRKPWLIIFLLCFGALSILSGFFLGQITDYILRGQTEVQFSNMSGRIYFWNIVWDSFVEKPIFGRGFYAGIRELYGVSGVDNTYLQVLIGGGVILFFVFVAAILIVIVQLLVSVPRQRKLRTHRAYFLLWVQTASLFTLIFIRSLTGPSFEAHHINLTFFLACSISASALMRFKEENIGGRYQETTDSVHHVESRTA